MSRDTQSKTTSAERWRLTSPDEVAISSVDGTVVLGALVVRPVL
ncbi:MAG TPA: hypothetical protein VMD09_12655 [Solirubrobacteraceae bacterium]|nr:hypothetical protein [Solirubrobacteraceae bacterium]